MGWKFLHVCCFAIRFVFSTLCLHKDDGPLVQLWRSNGLKAIMYLDDGIVDEMGAITASGWVRDTLAKARWVCNEAKSTCLPTHSLSWLGFTLDLELGCISVPDRKIEVLRGKLQTAMEQPMLRARFIASLVDRIIVMSWH